MSLMAQQQLDSVEVLDFHQFLFQTEQTYLEIKQNLSIQAPSFHLPHDKFSSPFQNKYAQLSSKFDQMINKIHLNFDDHKITLEDQHELIDHIVLNIDPNIQNCLIHLVSKLLINSQGLYQKWVNDQVSNLKEQLDLVILKNCQLETQIGQVYEDFQLLKQRLDDELNNRFELEKYCRSLEKDNLLLKQTNQEIANSNKSLVQSMKDLDEQVESTKEAQRITNHSQLIQKDMLNEQKQKANTLEQQNRILSEKIGLIQIQLEELRQQQDNFIEQIKHLTEIIENQNYELDFYKGKDLRESPSMIQHSFDKLNKYEDLLESYHNSSHKGSLKSFMLSHQKSMGKLTIFEARQGMDDRIFEKIQNPDMVLKSFDHIQNNRMTSEQRNDSFNFPDFNQLTFRPEADREVASSEQLNAKEAWNNELHVDFVEAQNGGQQTSRFEMQNFDEKACRQKGDVYIEPLKISGKKHRRQRSQSITEGNPALVSKRLTYDEMVEIKQDQVRQVYVEIRDKEQVDNNSQRGYSQSSNTMQQINKMRRMSSCIKLSRQENEMQTKSELKGLSFRYISNNECTDNRSEVNSVNKALIKKSIRVEKEIEGLKEKLEGAQQRVEEYEDVVEEMQSQIRFYKQELSKNIQMGIRLKSQIQAYKQEIQALEEYKQQQMQIYDQKCTELQQSLHTIDKLTNQIDRLTTKNQQLIFEKEHEQKIFNERLSRVKEYCRSYIEDKHKRQLQEISAYYERELLALSQQLSNKCDRPLMIDREIQLIKERQLSIQQNVQEKIISQIDKSSVQVQVQLEKCLLSMSSNLVMQTVQASKCQKPIQLTQQVLSLHVQNFVKCTSKSRLSHNSSQINISIDLQSQKHYRQSQKHYHQIHQTLNQTIYPNLENNHPKPNPTKKYAIHHIISQHFTIQATQKSSNPLSRTNTVSQTIIHTRQLKPQNHPIFTLSNQLQYSLQPQPIVPPFHAFNIERTLNLLISKPLFLKSPLMQKKQLLNTPSSINTLQTKKPSSESHKQQGQNHQYHYQSISQYQSTRQRQRNDSPQNINTQFNLNPIINDNEHDDNESNNTDYDPNQTFLTVSFVRNISSAQELSQPNDSFLTCIPFSSSQSITIQKENTQLILEQDIFVLKNQCPHQLDQGDYVETYELFQTHNCQQENTYQLSSKLCLEPQPLKPTVPSTVIQPLQLSINLNQTITKQKPNHDKPLTFEKNTLLQDTKPNKIEGYFPITLSNKNHNLETLQQYSQIFQRNLYQYFKKHTSFSFLQTKLPSQEIPQQQKMYLLHTQKLPSSRHAHNHKTFSSSQSQPNKTTQRFLLYKKLLLQIQTGRKLQIPNTHLEKYLLDSNKLILGNFQILITDQNQLKIARNHKKCFYFGDIQDGTWNINKVEEITFTKPTLKK